MSIIEFSILSFISKIIILIFFIIEVKGIDELEKMIENLYSIESKNQIKEEYQEEKYSRFD